MKILLVSDEECSYIWDYFDAERFKDIELIISCGDLKADYLSFLVTMIKAPLFYVPGNHDGKYDVKPPEGCESIMLRKVSVVITKDSTLEPLAGLECLVLTGTRPSPLVEEG
jgi:predicted phosphodiesterase